MVRLLQNTKPDSDLTQLIGGVVALGTIIPLGYSPVTDKTCVAIPWLLAPATCLTLWCVSAYMHIRELI